MKLIPLTRGQFAMVDDVDFEKVNAHKWYARKSYGRFYAARGVWADGKAHIQFLHHFLMPGVYRIDHRDGNSLNDQMDNLRPATKRQNSQGARRKRVGVSSKFRGVNWNKHAGKWAAEIKTDGKKIFLGYFTDETEAAHAYDSAAVFYFGEYASPNFDIGQITIT